MISYISRHFEGKNSNYLRNFKSFIGSSLGKKPHVVRAPKLDPPSKRSVLAKNGPIVSDEIKDIFDDISDLGWDIDYSIFKIGDKRDDRFIDHFYRGCRVSIFKNNNVTQSDLVELEPILKNSISRLKKIGFQLHYGSNKDPVGYTYFYLEKISSSGVSGAIHDDMMRAFSSAEIETVNISNDISFSSVLSRFKDPKFSLFGSFKIEIHIM